LSDTIAFGAGGDTDLVYKLVYDYKMKDDVHITLIATGIGNANEPINSFHNVLH